MPWVGHWRQEWEKVGRWRPLSEIKKLPKIQDVYNKRDGLLVLTANSKWNRYFSLDESESAFGGSELETAFGDSFTRENSSDAKNNLVIVS